MVWVILLLALLLLLAVLFVWYTSATHDTFQKMNIDSPPTSWFLGNFGQSFKLGIFQNQVDLYNKYRNKKVYGVYDLNKPVLIVSDLDMVKDIMVKSFNSFVNRRIFIEVDAAFKDNILHLKDDHWRQVRSITSPSFSSGRIKRIMQHVEKYSQRLVDKLRAKQPASENIELKSMMLLFTMDVNAGTGFGLEINTMENPNNPFAIHGRKLIRGASLSVLVGFLTPWLVKLLSKAGVSLIPKESIMFFVNAIDFAMEKRKAEVQTGKFSDFIDLLINAEQESGESNKGSLTRSEIHGQGLAFMLAGYESASNVLSFTLFLLANNPDCCHMVQKEIDEKIGSESPNYDNVQDLAYLGMCISESMRMFPPGFIIERVCTEDATIQGIHIPKDMVVSFPAYAIHHDPEIWPEPEKFQPERFSLENKESRHPYAYLAFGHGPRNCIGMRLAIVELKLILAYVLKSLTPVPCMKTVYPVKLDKFQLNGANGLWVQFKGRK